VQQASQEKYAAYSTARLQLRRQQIAESIPKMVVGWGGAAFVQQWRTDRLQEEKNEIEEELLRRYEAGDKDASVLPKQQGAP